jgi:hypothetical protein
MDVADAFAELFSAAREDFTALRDTWVKRAKSEQQADVADQLRALRKPTVAAWLVNQVSRRYPDDVDALIEVGDELREAHHSLAGDRLRSLSRRRQELSQTLTRHVRSVAESAGVSFSDSAVDQVETTWTTAAADSRAAEVLRAGHLSAALTPDSEQDWLAVAVATTSSRKDRPERAAPEPAKPSPPPVDRNALREAHRDLRQAQRSLDQARRAKDNADREAAAAAVGTAKLRDQLAELETRVAQAADEERDSKAEAAEAAKATTAAERAVRNAERTVAKLENE